MSEAKEPKEKKVRRTRRNYQKEIYDVTNYCRVSVDVMSQIKMEGPGQLVITGQLDAYARILKQLEGK